MFISSHQLVLMQPRWDIWGPRSSSVLSSALVLRYISVTLTPGSERSSALFLFRNMPLAAVISTNTRRIFTCSSHNKCTAGHVFSQTGLGQSLLLDGYDPKTPRCPIMPLFSLHDFSPIVTGFQGEAVVRLATLSLLTVVPSKTYLC